MCVASNPGVSTRTIRDLLRTQFDLPQSEGVFVMRCEWTSPVQEVSFFETLKTSEPARRLRN